MGPGTVVAVAGIGAGVGFLSGVFGKGGSAVATPLLAAVGIPPIAAVASPLPATIPTTMAAAVAYWREGMVDHRVVRWTLVIGLPATLAGAITTRWIGGSVLVLITDILITVLGLRVLWGSGHATGRSVDTEPPLGAIVAIAVGVGFSAGLLANSGGALLAPLYLTVLHLPIKRTFACSLTAAAALAVPATVVHAALGHIDWAVVAVFAIASVPLSMVGARLALRTSSSRLERAYGVVLSGLGLGFLIKGLV
jgi:uncharacterized membrane protein YfcA